jgi:hypothetical protein
VADLTAWELNDYEHAIKTGLILMNTYDRGYSVDDVIATEGKFFRVVRLMQLHAYDVLECRRCSNLEYLESLDKKKGE